MNDSTDNDAYEPVLDDPDLSGPDWLMLAAASFAGFALAGAVTALVLSRND